MRCPQRTDPEDSGAPRTLRLVTPALLALSLLAIAPAALASDFWAAPDGSPNASGQRNDPWDVVSALAQPAALRPGDTLWLRSGTYTLEQTLVSRVAGELGRPVKVRVEPGGRAQLDCAGVTRSRRGAICLEIYGRHAWYWGLEVFSSSPERRATRPGAAADPRGVGVVGRSGLGVRLINMVIHDVGTALFESQPSGLEVYGLLAYNNGWQGPDRSHGPGLYMRNRSGFPAKTIEDCVVFQNFRQGLQGYGSGPNVFSRFRVEGNVFFNNGIGRDGFHRNLMFGNSSPGHDDNVFRDNVTYYPPGFSSSAGSNRLGAAPGTCARLTLENNIFAHGPGRSAVEIEGCSELRLRGNLFHGRAQVDGAEMAAAYPENEYLEQPAGRLTRLRVNRYEPRRALLTVLNWSEEPHVEVELCGWSPPEGATITVRSAQDPFGLELRFPFDGEPLELPMTGWGAARPIGLETQPLPPTYPRFGVFLLSWDAPPGGLSE